MVEEVLEHFKRLHPDKMVLDKIDSYELGKLAGKVELLLDMARFVEEEYGIKFKPSV